MVYVRQGRGQSEPSRYRIYKAIEPKFDGFRNYISEDLSLNADYLLIELANLLGLSPVELCALVGGLRVLGVTHKFCQYGVLTEKPQCLTNDYYKNLLDQSIYWKRSDERENLYEAYDKATGKLKWVAASADFFGHNQELRMIAEIYEYMLAKTAMTTL